MAATVVYARISSDELGLGAGVQRQIEDTRALADARGWTISREYVDNDVSAFDAKNRTAYAEMMSAVDAGHVERIVVYMTSRLWRSRAERAAAIDRLGKLRVSVAAVKGPELDLSSASGRMVAGVLGEFDTHESEVKAERLQRAALQRAQQGKAHGRVPYGWRRIYETNAAGKVTSTRDELEPNEAEIVREMVKRLLTGETLLGVVDALNARVVPTPAGTGAWTHSMVKWLVTRPANVADRVHLGRVIGPGAWPPILDRTDYERIVALFSDPARRAMRDGSRRHLLSYGIGVCGVCGGELRAMRYTRPSGVFWAYKCLDAHVLRLQEPTDQLVGMVVCEWFGKQPSAAVVFYGDDEAATEALGTIEALRARLDIAADSYAAGDIDAGQLKRISTRLRADIEAAEATLRAARPGVVPDGVDRLMGDDALEAWNGLTVVQQRAILEAIGLTVRILHVPRGRGFKPEGIAFEWAR